MFRKRALWRVVALVLALGLSTAIGAQAAEGPSRGLTGFWTSIEVWFHDLVADWFGNEPTATTSKTESTEPIPPTNPPTGPFGPGTNDGSGGASTTDEGGTGDPNG